MRTLWVGAMLAAGCASDLPPLPPGPDSAGGEPGSIVKVVVEEGATPGDLLTPSRDGDRIHAGVIVLEPVLDPGTGTATFRVRNERPQDLPDLILAVAFAVPAPGPGSPQVPRFETVEAPLSSGETREFRVAAPGGTQAARPSGFRVVAGLPEVLAAPGEEGPGTTFLGGVLECVELEADLTGPDRRVVVGLAERPVAGGEVPLPPIEGQLLLSRGGELVWTGPWILLPRADPDGGRVRRVRWNLGSAPGLAGCQIFLRIREKR